MRSAIGVVLIITGIAWLWWGYLARTVVDAGGASGAVWLRGVGGVALIAGGAAIWFLWRGPRP